MSHGEKARTVIWMVLNAVSSVSIIYVNKILFRNHSFVYGTLLTAIHFFITAIGLFICEKTGVFKAKRLPFIKILPLCMSFCGFVALTNLSLLYNSIGFYQLIKVLTTPMIVVIQSLFYNKTFSIKVKLSLTLICVGVILATVSDASASLLGTVTALSALVVTSMYQIWVGSKQTELCCDSFQLLYNQAPLSAVLLLPIAYFSDHLGSTFYAPCWSTNVLILSSGFLAFLVNLSTFFVISRTSPVTYNVLGHFKLCVVLSLGYIFFSEEMSLRIFTGIVMVVFGVFWYTHLRMQDENTERSSPRLEVMVEEDHDGDMSGVKSV
ncbi:hypothetical protein JKF63_05855 [Porcisia hertigi]|uniref:Sugar phosphate transporter domain-containing protein n=1 Tax=Porcisia hertigi TaxID=2761500 RepID=A0A836LCL2_9TRYP|nr:hypothetical protein JKF63_05855 [Porcisia hertigi]